MSDGRAPHELHIPVEPPQKTNNPNEAQFDSPDKADAIAHAADGFDMTARATLRSCERLRAHSANIAAQIRAGIHIPETNTDEFVDRCMSLVKGVGMMISAAMIIKSLLDTQQKESR